MSSLSNDRPADLSGLFGASLVGGLVGVTLVGRAVALSALVFAGALAAGAWWGTLVFLAGTLVTTLALTARRDMPLALGAVQDAPVAVLMPAIAGIAAGLGATRPEVGAATVTALLGLLALLGGILFILVAKLDLGRVIRLIPYPVAAGFLASTGAILMLAALRLAAPVPLGDLYRHVLESPGDSIVLSLTIGFAALVSLLSRWRRDLGPVLAIAVALAGTYAAIHLTGLGIEEARNIGLLPLNGAEGGTGARILPDPSRIDWPTLLAAVPAVAGAAVIAVIGLLLNIAGIEIRLRTDIDSRRILLDTGFCNLALGLVGGTASFLSATATLTAHSMGGRSRALALSTCAVLLLGGVAARDIVLFTPRFITAGLLLQVAFEVVYGWFLSPRLPQDRSDRLLIGGIVAIALIFGMLPAIGAGIVLSTMVFAVSYGRQPIIGGSDDLSARRSTLDRGPAQSAALDLHAHEVATVSLQGYLFFGSAEQLVGQVRRLLGSAAPARRIVLDFRKVSGMDSAAIAALHKLEYQARRHGATIVMADIPARLARAPALQAILNRGILQTAPSADAALEAAENEIIGRMPAEERQENARSALAAATGTEDLADRLLAIMARQIVTAGDILIRAGEISGDIYILDSGRLAVRTTSADGRAIRVRAFRPGALIGEIASYTGLPRSADVVAECDCVVYRITPEAIDDLLCSDPALAAAWHRAIAATLAERTLRTTEMLRRLS